MAYPQKYQSTALNLHPQFLEKMMTKTLPEIVEQKIQQWLHGSYDEATKAQIRTWIDQQADSELVDAFYKDLTFGTGGLRGVMGVGSNRMNRYTVGMATQGIAQYLRTSFPNESLKVAIAHDSRNQSSDFAQIVADVFSANGIEVYLFQHLRPTPLLSFAIRHLGCQSGVVITASHNPKEYNGYKAYWKDGAQLTSPHDARVMEVVAQIGIEQVKFTRNPALVHILDGSTENTLLEKVAAPTANAFFTLGAIENAFLQKAIEQCPSPQLVAQQASQMKVVYTPLHGTGITLVPEILNRLGLEDLYLVSDQIQPNGNFPTVVYPNPEEAEALTLALAEAKKIDADLVLATDPDADRVGIAVKNSANEWQLLNGNQTGVLIMYYLLTQWQQQGKLHGQPYLVKTVVTSYLIDAIARHFQVNCYNTLTGFKYIAEIIREKEGQQTFIAGCEESYGYMIGDFVRDKDAITTCALLTEILAYAKSQGTTLYGLLLDIYTKFGLYVEHLVSITKKGKEGAEEIKAMMAGFRANPPAQLGGSKVVRIADYELQIDQDLVTGQKTPITLEKSNVLQFFTADGGVISARPSGTEPKIKFYFSLKTDLPNPQALEEKTLVLKQTIEQIIHDLHL